MLLRTAYIISILSIFLFTSCASKSDVSIIDTYTDFPQEQELKSKTILLDTALFRYPFRLHIGNDKAVVLDLHGTDYSFMRSAILIFITYLLLGSVGMHRKICFLPKIFDGMGLFGGH
ncbi:uncharacterized protein BN604_03020 [Bacteroides intestinalis CAG:315]|jgi:hypothetical protein|nr:uncharacterized protein BN604_03020 [Bacteroides intestinalis CAG:315]